MAAEAFQDMNDRTAWQRVPCVVADILRMSSDVTVFSSLTDPDGIYGTPVIYTEWGLKASETPVLREYRYPVDADGDGPCEHYTPEWS